MELVNDFTVKAPIDEAYATLTDVERIAAPPAPSSPRSRGTPTGDSSR